MPSTSKYRLLSLGESEEYVDYTFLMNGLVWIIFKYCNRWVLTTKTKSYSNCYEIKQKIVGARQVWALWALEWAKHKNLNAVGSETLRSTCSIISDQCSVPFHSMSYGLNYPFLKVRKFMSKDEQIIWKLRTNIQNYKIIFTYIFF